MTPRERFEELLALDLDGELSPTDRAELESLVAGHAEWAEEARQERELVALLREGGQAKAPVDLAARAIAAVESGGPGITPSGGGKHSDGRDIGPPEGAESPKFGWRQQALAAAILLFFAGGSMAVYFGVNKAETTGWQQDSAAGSAVFERKTVAMERQSAALAMKAEGFAPAAEVASIPSSPVPGEAQFAMVMAAPAEESKQADIFAAREVAPAPPEQNVTTAAAATILAQDTAPQVLADTPYLTTALAILSGKPVPEQRRAPQPGVRFRVIQEAGKPQLVRYEIASGPDAARLYDESLVSRRADILEESRAEYSAAAQNSVRKEAPRPAHPAFPEIDVLRGLEAMGGIGLEDDAGVRMVQFPSMDAALRAVEQLRRGESDPVLDHLEVLATGEGLALVVVNPAD